MYDYLIIGHGLAGALLSQRMLDGGKKVLVLDQPKMNYSSSVAAGLFNPITGRKMNKTWRADVLFPELVSYYQALEVKLGATFFHEIGVYRPYTAQEDQNDWEAKNADDKFQSYIDHTTKTPHQGHHLHDTFGGLHLKQAGYVDIPTFLSANKKYLTDKGMYQESLFSEESLIGREDHFSYKDKEYKKIIFCDGAKAAESALFGWLPFHLVKGEVLDIKMDKMPTTIYNRGIFILPFNNKNIRVGATYQKKFDNLIPSDEGIAELNKKLRALLNEPYEVNDVRAGVRPATKDRRPFIGKHPNNEHIYLFNGFGSKGVSLIPYFSKMLADHLLIDMALDPDTDISRYASLYDTSLTTE